MTDSARISQRAPQRVRRRVSAFDTYATLTRSSSATSPTRSPSSDAANTRSRRSCEYVLSRWYSILASGSLQPENQESYINPVSEDPAIPVSRGRQGWIIPKGWPIRHLTAAATAAREAYEEAGVIGTVLGDEPCRSFLYEKQKGPRGRTICVSVFLFAVERQLRKWPERSQRMTRWIAPEEASLLVAPIGLVEIFRVNLVNSTNTLTSRLTAVP